MEEDQFQLKLLFQKKSNDAPTEDSPWTWGNLPSFHPHTSRMAPA